MSGAMESVTELLAAVERTAWVAPPRDPKIEKWTPEGPIVSRLVTSKFRLRDLGAAVPLGFEGLSCGLDEVGPVPYSDDVDDALEAPLDITIAHQKDGALEIARTKRVEKHIEVLGLVRRPMPKMWKSWAVRIEEGRVVHSVIDVFGETFTPGIDTEEARALNGGKPIYTLWMLTKQRFAKQDRSTFQEADFQDALNLRIARGISLANEYAWHVDVGRRDGLRVALVTDAEGARAMLRQRDVAPGERRKALVHWVQAHHRKRRVSDDVSWVRAHLRGEEDASWAGIPVRVRPSSYDLRRLEMGVAP